MHSCPYCMDFQVPVVRKMLVRINLPAALTGVLVFVIESVCRRALHDIAKYTDGMKVSNMSPANAATKESDNER